MVDRPQRKASKAKAGSNGDPTRRGRFEVDRVTGLTDKRSRFVSAYIGPARFNKSEAARLAGYSGKRAGTEGWRLLKNAEVQAALNAALENNAIGRAEWAARLADHFRADISQLADCWVLDEAPDGSKVRRIDLVKVGQKGLGHLIARITPTKCGDAIELVDRLRAADMLGRAAGWLREDHTHFHLPNDLSLYSDSQIAAMRRGEDPGPPALAGQQPKTVEGQEQLEPPKSESQIIETTGGEESGDGPKGV